MINMLLCCEGITDQGKRVYDSGEYINTEGVMQILIKKVYGKGDVIFTVKTRQELKSIAIRKKYLNKQEITSKRLALLAKQNHCTHIAFHRDEDNKGFDEMYAQVKSYFIDLEKRGCHCIAIVPMHMTESWLLSDKKAYGKMYKSEPVYPELPAKPEEAWGKKDADTHPKKYLNRVLGQYNATPSPDVYSEIAEYSDVAVLTERCPVSFGRFVGDMKTLFFQ